MALSAKKIANLVDAYYRAREVRRAEQRKVDALKEKETKVWHELKDALINADIKGVAGVQATVELLTKQKPVVTDEDKLHKFIIKNDAWDLLQKTIVASAAKARWEDNLVIPGLKSEPYLDLSIGKV